LVRSGTAILRQVAQDWQVFGRTRVHEKADMHWRRQNATPSDWTRTSISENWERSNQRAQGSYGPG